MPVSERNDTPTPAAKVRERFVRDVAEHEMTVLKDDGLYRHLRFQRVGASFYWFDLVTWPGVLAVSGDCGTFVFSRTRDMFEFFRPSGARGGFEDARWGINPDYWSEKLRAPSSRDVRIYTYDAFKAHVLEWLADARDYYGDLEDEDDLRAFKAAVDEQILDDPDGEAYRDEGEAHRRLRDFEHGGRSISDSWEWDLREYDWQFLWCCWAIVWGIGQYDAKEARSNAR